ncbi:hypothetical protein [Serratia ureilytica]|uniref:hypothetical protein n=1 Tax=Serratia ureilytica TaxID=300181 RepID=UPI0038680B9F
MLVRTLEEKSRALADAERERDDWVEHSRRMEYRVIEAKELLANREVQPVGKPFGYYSEETTALLGRRGFAPISADPLVDHNKPLYTAPPAPAMPDALKRAVTFYEQVKRENTPIETGAWKDAVDWVLVEACRAAMLAAAPEGDNDHDTRR